MGYHNRITAKKAGTAIAQAKSVPTFQLSTVTLPL